MSQRNFFVFSSPGALSLCGFCGFLGWSMPWILNFWHCKSENVGSPAPFFRLLLECQAWAFDKKPSNFVFFKSLKNFLNAWNVGDQVSAFSESRYVFSMPKTFVVFEFSLETRILIQSGVKWGDSMNSRFASLRSAWLALPASVRGHFSFVWWDFLQVSCCSAFLRIFLASRRLLRRLWQGWFWKLWIEIQSMVAFCLFLQIPTWKWCEVLSVLTLIEFYHFDLVGLGAKHVARVARHARGPKVNARRCDGFAMDNLQLVGDSF